MGPHPTSSTRLRASYGGALVLTALGLATGCGSSGSDAGGGASGGASNAGSAGLGGTTSAGGALASGGSAGNSTSTGGASGNGGSAGSSGSGGSAGTATGGASGSGGAGGTGGTAGAAYRPCPTDGAPCKIMPFGDSITDGFGTGGAYRVELFRLAHQAGKNITFVGSGSNGPSMVDDVTFPPQHEGHSGFTIDPTQSRAGISPLVSTVMPQFTPHIVTLMIGTNDAIDSYELGSAPDRLGALIDSIYAELPDVLVVVAKPIPSQEDDLNTRLQAYGATIPAVVEARAAAGKHILLVDMYASFVAVSDYKSSLLKDTWHPNEAGHAILGAEWYAALAPSL